MVYDWNMPLIPGTIVCAKYNDFDGVERVGIFCVLYDEQLDTNTPMKKNAVCVKISTQATLVSSYSVRVNIDKNEFLSKPCIVCCSKEHLLHKETNIYKILGFLDKGTYKEVVKTYLKFSHEIQRQLMDLI